MYSARIHKRTIYSLAQKTMLSGLDTESKPPAQQQGNGVDQNRYYSSGISIGVNYV